MGLLQKIKSTAKDDERSQVLTEQNIPNFQTQSGKKMKDFDLIMDKDMWIPNNLSLDEWHKEIDANCTTDFDYPCTCYNIDSAIVTICLLHLVTPLNGLMDDLDAPILENIFFLSDDNKEGEIRDSKNLK